MLTSELLLTERLDAAGFSPAKDLDALRSLEDAFERPSSSRFSAQQSAKGSRDEEVSFVLDEDGYLLDSQGSRG